MRYVFGDYSLDTQCYELRRAGELIPLGPQVFNVLVYLMAHRDRVVSRDELFARLWAEQFVTDDALGRCIRAARYALEDRPEAPWYIATSRGRGDRFIAPVSLQSNPQGSGVMKPLLETFLSRRPVLPAFIQRAGGNLWSPVADHSAIGCSLREWLLRGYAPFYGRERWRPLHMHFCSPRRKRPHAGRAMLHCLVVSGWLWTENAYAIPATWGRLPGLR
jgi:DNA-binding winged helix-turn-helix (wHTH) protein